uniref:OSJNBb0089B03.16 protein n=1 Tax=Oryza sativa subsp. japonica TaxID=39947 RepID=Q7XNP5_ORYSJ|nr:OSJNBb0089B03.16 [Oryza sativa Japonica Group]
METGRFQSLLGPLDKKIGLHFLSIFLSKSYHHREYQATIRSKPEVELFMETTLQNRTNIFKGRKLQKKWRMDSCAEGSTGGSKSTKRKKINSSTEKKKPLSIGNEPLKLTLPHGFV